MLNAFQRKLALVVSILIATTGLLCISLNSSMQNAHHCPIMGHVEILCSAPFYEYLQVALVYRFSDELSLIFISLSLFGLFYLKKAHDLIHSIWILRRFLFSNRSSPPFFPLILQLISRGILQPRLYNTF